jgi:Cu/Ag efflux pump CusA
MATITAVPQPIEVKLFAADPTPLRAHAEKIAALIARIDGVVEVKSGLQLAGDALDVRIDPIRAAFEGVAPTDVGTAISDSLTGSVATSLPQPEKVVDVRVRLPNALTIAQDELARLSIRAADRHVLSLPRRHRGTGQRPAADRARELGADGRR